MNNIPTRAIVDTGAPFCIISSAFAKCLNKSPDIIHSKQYGTAGPHATTSLGAYSALLLQIGAIIISVPAVVLQNNNYTLLIGTSLLKNYGVDVCHKNNRFTILGHSVPLHYNFLSTEKQLSGQKTVI